MKINLRLPAARYGVVAFATVMALDARDAFAQTIGENVNELGDDLSAIGKFTLAGSFLLGVVLIIQGIMKLIESHNTEGRTKLSAGFWRLGLGAIGMGIGVFSGVLTNTLGLGNITPETSEVPF